MNNEDKILAMLEQLQQGQTAMQGDIQGINTRLDGIDTRLDGIDTRLDGIDTRLDGIDLRLDELEEAVHVVRDSQLLIEHEQYPRIQAALDGLACSEDRDHLLDERVTFLESKDLEHDKRLLVLERAAG